MERMRWTIQRPWDLRNSMVLNFPGFLSILYILERMLEEPQPRNANVLTYKKCSLCLLSLGKGWGERQSWTGKGEEGDSSQIAWKMPCLHPHPTSKYWVASLDFHLCLVVMRHSSPFLLGWYRRSRVGTLKSYLHFMVTTWSSPNPSSSGLECHGGLMLLFYAISLLAQHQKRPAKTEGLIRSRVS